MPRRSTQRKSRNTKRSTSTGAGCQRPPAGGSSVNLEEDDDLPEDDEDDDGEDE